MKNAVLFVALSIVLYACKKDKKDDLPPAISGFDYYPMDSGNYWIYEWYEVDSNGNSLKASWKNDTVMATGDTVIQGRVFKKVSQNTYGGQVYYTAYYRDSSGFLVDVTGMVILSANEDIDTLGKIDTIDLNSFGNQYLMNHNAHSVTVPAGTFNVIDLYRVVFDLQGGTFCTGTNSRRMTNTYAKGYGRITANTFYSNDPFCKYLEARLIKYYVLQK